MSQTRRNVLGRGLSALIPDANETAPSDRQIQELPIEQIMAANTQPRTQFDEERITALAESLKTDGFIQPIVVRRVGQATFTIIAGERRYRASKKAGLSHVPVVVRDVTEAEAYELALVENVQREDLNPIEEAEAYQYLSKSLELSHEAIAKKVGRDRVTITNALRLLKLSQDLQTEVAYGTLTAGHGRALLMAPTAERESLAEQAIKGDWSVRRTEKEAKALKNQLTQPPATKNPNSPAHRAVEDQLRAALGAPVKLVQKKGVGRIEVRFHSMDELERLLDLIASLEGR
ncbi:MAG: ParB/RepB/Spo0J family partition protein [Bradymonadia bacterium]